MGGQNSVNAQPNPGCDWKWRSSGSGLRPDGSRGVPPRVPVRNLCRADVGTGGIRGELLLFWGRQDPHVPLEGRKKIYNALCELNLNFTWHEFNGQHAYIRDEGHRYDPALAMQCLQMALELFHRKLGEGDWPAQAGGGPSESRP